MTPPFRAEHIGSLLRPRALIEARNITSTLASATARSEYVEIQNAAIAAVVEQQLARGVQPITSGEYERHIFYSDFFNRLAGFELRRGVSLDTFLPYFPTIKVMLENGVKTRDCIICTEKVRHVTSPLLEEWLYLRSLLPESQWGQCKVTIPSPTYFHIQLQQGKAWEEGVYDSDEAFFDDVCAAYRKEFEVLYQAGVRNIQVDDPNLSFFCDQGFLAGLKKRGLDAQAKLESYVRMHNACLEGLPADLHVGIHLCRGMLTSGSRFLQIWGCSSCFTLPGDHSPHALLFLSVLRTSATIPTIALTVHPYPLHQHAVSSPPTATGHSWFSFPNKRASILPSS